MKKKYKLLQAKENLKTNLKKIFFSIAAFCFISASSNAQTASALNFDGVNDYCNSAVFSTITNNITLQAKVYWTGTTGNSQFIVYNGNSGGNGYGLFLPAGSNQVNYIYGGLSFNSVFTLSPNVWTSISMVITTNLLVIYKDGVLTNSIAIGNPAAPSGGSFVVGSGPVANTTFNGTIDEVLFWNVARTQCDINTYMNCEIAGSAPGLLANYHFNQGIAGGSNAAVTTLTDASGNGNNLVLGGPFALSGSTSNWVSPGGVISGYTTTTAPTVSVASTASSVCAGLSTTLTNSGSTDLVAYYRLNEGSGLTTQDLSGNNLTGTLVNTPVWGASTATITGAGNALTFNNGYINVADNAVFASLQNKLTIEAWIYQTDGADNAIVDRANYNFLFEARPNGQTGLGFYNPNGLWTYSSGTIPLNQWVHVAVSYDGANGTVKFYMNGALLSVHNRPFPLTFNAGPMNIGRQEPNSCQCNIFTGMLDEVKIWRSVRNQAQLIPSLNSTITPMAFSWSPAGSLNTSLGSSVSASPSVTTIYTTTITDASGCSNNASTTITVNSNPTISVNSGTICSGKNFTLVPTGANTYTVQGTSLIKNPTISTNYTVIGTSSAGCVSTSFATSSITVNSNPTITVNSGSICSGYSFTLNPSGANTYTFQGGTAIVSPTTNSSYTVIGTSALGCISQTFATSNLTVIASPTITTNSGSICSGSSFTIVPTGANTYTFQGGNAVVSPTSTASYSIIGTNTIGCVSPNAAISNVTVNALPTLVISSSSSVICLGSSATLTANGAISFTWSTNSTTSLIAVSPSVTTSYTVNGTDANGCMNKTSITQSVSLCTGLNHENLTAIAQLYVYPNPTSGNVTIKNENFEIGSKLEVCDLFGKLILAEEMFSETSSLDLSNLSNGIYFVKLIENNKVIATQKIIKN